MRRSGVSLKVSDSSLICTICRNINFEFICYICKRKICSSCICDLQKYCILCDKDGASSYETVIRVPTKLGKTGFIRVKNNKYCCFM